MKKAILAALALAAIPFVALADDDDAKPEGGLGLAGMLSKSNREAVPHLTLSAGQPVSKAPLKLKSGKYYILKIEADGSQELALEGAGFFRAVWVNEIVIEGIEIRPLGVDSIEFDEAGEAEISFIAIKPGSYHLKVPGSTGDTQQVAITIE
ncbi:MULTISPECIES: hypothetical protein [unclassified Rhizobium]|uniref:hypothetical protein n=1 Tax=unclassified Rhizobium TaxID=2613769 RepID=UPI0007145ACB|nr:MULTISPECIES: hypothetical protein [unclassified Rhizobium]KQS83120.1 hypothetical protein ASG50_12010 [Rhizobium sp. Leaf386]KQS88993.1 hypothetical protein ASG42_14620 [Rhizobium sp. Leaf391]KQT92841.1 hypothetical protein ASG68_15810 [Rhizobium sp. Leaf453]